jgi:hypothetical protein
MAGKLEMKKQTQKIKFNLLDFIFCIYLGSIQGFLFGLLLFGSIIISIILSLLTALSLYFISSQSWRNADLR